MCHSAAAALLGLRTVWVLADGSGSMQPLREPIRCCSVPSRCLHLLGLAAGVSACLTRGKLIVCILQLAAGELSGKWEDAVIFLLKKNSKQPTLCDASAACALLRVLVAIIALYNRSLTDEACGFGLDLGQRQCPVLVCEQLLFVSKSSTSYSLTCGCGKVAGGLSFPSDIAGAWGEILAVCLCTIQRCWLHRNAKHNLSFSSFLSSSLLPSFPQPSWERGVLDNVWISIRSNTASDSSSLVRNN